MFLDESSMKILVNIERERVYSRFTSFLNIFFSNCCINSLPNFSLTMLKLLLPLLIYPVPFFAQNLVIDVSSLAFFSQYLHIVQVSRNAIQEYVSSMSTHFKDEILKAKLPPMDASRFICGVTLKDTTVTDFNFSKFSSELAGPYKDYYLNVSHPLLVD